MELRSCFSAFGAVDGGYRGQLGTDVHELSVCQALLTQVAALARQRNAASVDHITIEVGPLSGIEPHLLYTAFMTMRLTSVASRAQLLIKSTEVIVRCNVCGAQSQVEANRLVCGTCGGFRTRVVAGDEMRLRQVSMRVAESPIVSIA